MDCLWLTLADPDPAINGQLIYSKGLIESTHRAGAALHIIGLSRPHESQPRRDETGLVWQLTAIRRTSRWQRLLSNKPEIALRSYSQEAVAVLRRALTERDWAAVVFDSICAGWALDTVVQHRSRSARPPRLVYLAHNHEATVAQRIARASRGLRRIVREVDAFKIARLERRLVAEADLVTSNTPDDCRTFAAGADGTPVAFLPPGYGGTRVASRAIGAGIPRRVVVIGSFDWPPKRIAMESFLAVAAPVLAGAGIELQIVGAELHEEVEHHVEHLMRTGVFAVDLVDDDDRLGAGFERLAQHEAGLRLRTIGGVHDEQHAVNHVHDALDFAAEIRVAGSVHDVDVVILVFEGGVLGGW